MAHPADHPGPLAFVDDLEAPALSEADLHHLGAASSGCGRARR